MRVASSPDNDGTHQHCQMVRVRLARQRGVTRVNQWLNPLKCGTGSNLVDMGRAAVRVSPWTRGEATPAPVVYAGWEATGEGLRRTRGEAAAAKLDADPIDRYTVNTGTVPGSPSPRPSQGSGGQAHRRLMARGWGGGSVVVRAWESHVHGEGTQRVRSRRSGTPGCRR